MLKNFLGKKENRPAGRKKKKKEKKKERDETERVTGLGRRTRQDIAKWNQMKTQRFQTGRDIRHPRPTFGELRGDNFGDLLTDYGQCFSVGCG